jgi:hypothetical protein
MKMAEFSGKRAYEILKAIGHERLTGTAGEKKAARTLARYFRSFGLKASEESFKMETYTNDAAWIEVLEPYRKRYEAAVWGLSGSTPRKGIVMPFKYVENLQNRYIENVKGTAILMGGGMSMEKYETLLDKGVKVLISISPPKKSHNRKPLRKVMREKVGKIHGIDVLFDDALEMVKRKASKVRVYLKQDETTTTSQNVIAEVKGTKHPDEIIVCVAHYDSISQSIGGHDNASGAAIICALAEAVAKAPLARTVRFLEFGGEEFGLCGSQAYAKRHKKDLESVKLCLNVDIAGPIFGTNNSFVTGPDQLRYYLECMGHELGMAFSNSTDVYSSDNVSFAEHGIPTAAITRGGGYVCEVHSSNDRYVDIDAEHLAVTGRFLHELLKRIGDGVDWPFPREIPEEQKKKVQDYIDRMRGTKFKPRTTAAKARAKTKKRK